MSTTDRARARHAHQILTLIASGHAVSQRSLAARLGIALGLTNELMRELIARNKVRMTRQRANRVRYRLTPSGVEEEARLSRLALRDSLRFYRSVRERIRVRLIAAGLDPQRRRVVFYGTGEVAEIAYICLQDTALELVGVVNHEGAGKFFGFDVESGDRIRDGRIGGVPFDRLVVTSLDDRDAARVRLEVLGVEPERVFWL